jgi:hypothetical protein
MQVVILQMSIYSVPLECVLANIAESNYMLHDEWFGGLCDLYIHASILMEKLAYSQIKLYYLHLILFL